ncbi:MAG: glycosyltransferase [Acidobacteriota bacterium]|nr:glycosyltransferase [Acidobacteriota bacterium]
MKGKRLTVMHFTSARERGGAEAHLAALVRALDREAFEPLVACPPPLATQLREELGTDVEVVPIDLRGARDFRIAPRIAILIARRKIDILHSHLFASSLVASPAGRLAGARAVIETPHVNEKWRHGPWKSQFLVDRLVARTVDAFIAVSAANARYLVGVKRLPARKVRVIPNGVDLARFATPTLAPGEMRRRLGFGDSDPVIVVVGRLERQKGHRVLLDALPRVLATMANARVAIVGDGSLRSELETQSRALGLAGAVRFVGWQSNVADWLALADVVALPSFYEGLPLAALEALAAQRPLVATAVDGTPEVVRDGRTGLTVPPGEPARLAEAILRMLRDPAFGARLALAGRELVAQRFTHERQVRETEQLYREIWERRAGQRTAEPGDMPLGNRLGAEWR